MVNRLLFMINPGYAIGRAITKPIERKITRAIEDGIEVVNPRAAYKIRRFNETVENLEVTLNNAIDATSTINIANRMIFSSDDFGLGDHLFVQRIGYTHHAIYIGRGEIIHYLNDKGVIKMSLSEFAAGANIHTKFSPKTYLSDEVVCRAYSRLGENNYNLAFNNCENFARWCRNGRKY
ncbi:lecithin retinol acyltransferase family protein [Lysinibacillus sp. 38-6]|uniref:lecithin retinol acyltransferase family protein n=1 Tax=Lysinibacillus sp. 38-6 TaxID=3385991 RepID=UPI003908B47E